jgi:hypothetical protein
MPVSSSRAAGALASLLVLLSAAGCGIIHDSSSPSSTNTDTFSGTLSPQGSAVRTFTITQAGTVSVTLTSLSPALAVGLGIGTPSGTHGCTLTTSTSVAVAGTTAQIRANVDSGSFCVQIYDTGNLTTAVTYSINVTHP